MDQGFPDRTYQEPLGKGDLKDWHNETTSLMIELFWHQGHQRSRPHRMYLNEVRPGLLHGVERPRQDGQDSLWPHCDFQCQSAEPDRSYQDPESAGKCTKSNAFVFSLPAAPKAPAHTFLRCFVRREICQGIVLTLLLLCRCLSRH